MFTNQSDTPIANVPARPFEATESQGANASGGLNLRPGLTEQVPGTEVRNGPASDREEALFHGGFTFEQIAPLPGFGSSSVLTQRDVNDMARILVDDKQAQSIQKQAARS